MKSTNDYLAEYVRKKRPEIEHSIDFIMWRLGAQMRDAISVFTDHVKSIADFANNKMEGKEDEVVGSDALQGQSESAD